MVGMKMKACIKYYFIIIIHLLFHKISSILIQTISKVLFYSIIIKNIQNRRKNYNSNDDDTLH